MALEDKRIKEILFGVYDGEYTADNLPNDLVADIATDRKSVV